jgi:hypothetical protein
MKMMNLTGYYLHLVGVLTYTTLENEQGLYIDKQANTFPA